ncbi:hypothetical protein GCM10023310_32150 [Paenibacillus vulneris]
MILIGIAFGCIIGYEWFYLKRKQRKQRTYFIVLGTALFLFLGTETLYIFKDKFTMARLVQSIFMSIENYIAGGGTKS